MLISMEKAGKITKNHFFMETIALKEKRRHLSRGHKDFRSNKMLKTTSLTRKDAGESMII